ncbi:GBF-interacting protein 1-like isoform X3 [Phalaenopsis equestris]|uniref:GBF-interacting protein 1-like isoform X3 n=1 Tax=Phalaenopsis equestris TaxID=78828 RepID=UPI0009E4209D|nr:GBF-interacting protein 1-like isoform X3 [Phalaenopsis equestris]
MSAVSRVSIPHGVKNMIQNIKEIAGNHGDEEIYSMLKECSMDPNETAQKLLFQDTFHEVRRKREKRKESIREATDNNWRPGSQGRIGRTVRGNYNSHYAFHDSGAGRNTSAVKENGIAQVRDKYITSSHSTPNTIFKAAIPETRSTTYKARSAGNLPNGLSKTKYNLPNGLSNAGRLSADDSGYRGGLSVKETAVESKTSGISFQKKISAQSTNQVSSSLTSASSAGVNAPKSGPVLAPSFGLSIPVSAGPVKQKANTDSVISRDVGGSELLFVDERDALEKKHSFGNSRIHGNSLDVEKTLLHDSSQSAPSNAVVGSSSSRPSSNYGNRSQHASAPMKAGPVMEWKPKSTNVNSISSSEVRCCSGVDPSKGKAREAISCSLNVSESMVSDISKKVPNLEDLRISDTQHVIIPDHLQVPESERTGLSFGSFGLNFGLDMGLKIEPEKIECLEEPSELSGKLEENVEQFPSCSRDESPLTEENTYSDDQQPEMPENHSASAIESLSSISPVADYDQSTPEVSLAKEASQHSIIHTAPVYSNFGLVAQKIGSPFPAFEATEIHARDTARLPGFIQVPQPFDPSTNYYTSFYRPAADGDGRFSPFLLSGGAPKFNGNIAILPPQASQSTQEIGNSMILSSTGPTPIVAQTTGVLQNSVAVSQQPVPVFRQPAGVHISHYPPNYNLYNQYFSPFYIPPAAAIHHYLGNAPIFTQQPSTGNLYPLPTATAGTTPVKYPISQYKAATNSVPAGQGAYGMTLAGYNSSVSSGNSTSSDDLSSSQFKENYVYIPGQQSEGSAVWISPPGRDISTLQPSSFYNIPSHGQPVAFAPTQAGHAAAAASFTGLYHPTQSLSAGSVHPLLQQSQAISGASEIAIPTGVYQQPQRPSQINWVNNF